MLRLLTTGCGAWQNRAHGAACPQLAKADMRAFGRHLGFDPTETLVVHCANGFQPPVKVPVLADTMLVLS